MAETVRVIVRCRPMNKRENNLSCKEVVSMSQGLTCSLVNPDEPGAPPKTFTFDGAYHTDSTTEQIYTDVAFNLVESVTEGYNGTVFAYGQTGCGKSFTMQGITDPASQRGIIPRSFEHIFEVIQTAENMKYLVHASYLEIYNEEIRDLLGDEVRKKLDLKEHPEKGVYVQGLSLHSVHNTLECEQLMEKGWANRSTGATLMNADSSRSHSIFTISLEMMNTAGDSDAIRSGKLNLVDLAGSERQAKTGATGDRLKEATKINLSLSALGNVISALVDGKSKHIPYRDSKLTRLLQDSLGGNTKTLMVACLSPADNNYDETLSTLRYANRAKNIKNKPKVNEDPKDAMLREYQDEIRKLKELLDSKGPQETVLAMKPDEYAIEAEKEKVRLEYEGRMERMKEDMKAERESNAMLQNNMERLKQKYEDELRDLNRRIQMKTPSTQKNMVERSEQILNEDGTIFTDDEIPDTKENSSSHANVKTQNAEMMTSMQQEALVRLKELQQQMVGGEKAQDKELKAKRMKRKKHMEKRMKYLSEALKNVDDEDGIMIKVYDDIHEELRAKSELAKKQKQKMKSMDQEIKDLTEEFQTERTDYLESIRKLNQQVKLLQAILERVQPTIRKDCNYSDLDSIKKEAIWDDEYQRWKVPDLTVQKTKLPPAGFAGQVSKTKTVPSPKKNPSKPWLGSHVVPTSQDVRSASTDESLDDGSPEDTDNAYLQPSEQPSFQKLQREEDLNLAASYFKPNRAKELLSRFKGDTNGRTSMERTKKASTSNNFSLPMGPGALTNGLSNSFNNSQGSTGSSSWASSSGGGTINSYGGSGGNLNTLSNVMSNGWLGTGNGVSSLSPEMSLRKPNRLEALPSDTRNKKNSYNTKLLDFL